MQTASVGQSGTVTPVHHISLRGVKDHRRAVVSSERQPGSDRRWLYKLDCGHTVSRRQDAAKRVCLCGACQAEAA